MKSLLIGFSTIGLTAIALLSLTPNDALGLWVNHDSRLEYADIPAGIVPTFKFSTSNIEDHLTPTSELRNCAVLVAPVTSADDPIWTTSDPRMLVFGGAKLVSQWYGDQNNYEIASSSDIRSHIFPNELRPGAPMSYSWKVRCERVDTDPTEHVVGYEYSTEIGWLKFLPRPNPKCIDGTDNDGDGLVDAADPQCDWEHDDTEAPVPPSKLSWELLKRSGRSAASTATGKRFAITESRFSRIKCRKRSEFTGVCDLAWVPRQNYLYVATVVVQVVTNETQRDASEIVTQTQSARAKLRCVLKQRRCRYRSFRRKTKTFRYLDGLRRPARSPIWDFYDMYDSTFKNPFGPLPND